MADEICYVCALPVIEGERVYQLKDDDGLVFYAHKACAERDMAPVAAENAE